MCTIQGVIDNTDLHIQTYKHIKEAYVLTLGRALVRYQCQGISPHSPDRFSTVLKKSTTPSGHNHLHTHKTFIDTYQVKGNFYHIDSVYSLYCVVLRLTVPRNKSRRVQWQSEQEQRNMHQLLLSQSV